MKKISIFLAAILVVFSFSACFSRPAPSIGNGSSSAPGTDVSDTSPAADVSDEISVTEPEVSDDTSEVTDLSKLTARELIGYSNALMQAVDSAKATRQTDTHVSANGEEYSYSYSTIEKWMDLNTDSPTGSVTHTDPDSGETASIYYKDSKGYFSSSSGRLSFDCTYDEFNEFIGHYTGTGDHFASPVTGEYEPDDEETQARLYDMMSVTVLENGGYKVEYSGTLTGTDIIEGLFGLEEGGYDATKGLKLEYVIYIDEDGFTYSQTMKTEFDVLYSEDFRASASAVLTYEISDINKTIAINVPESGFNHIGSINGMYFRYCYDQINLLDNYSSLIKHNYELQGFGRNDKITASREFIVDKTEDPVFSYDFKLSLNGTPDSLRQYYEDGVYYYKYGNDIQSQEIGYIDDSSLLSFWVTVYPEYYLGKNYSFTDNGDGTGTLTFVYTDSAVASIGDFMLYSIYGQASLFAGAQSVTVNKATAEITTNLKDGTLISHKYDIDAVFNVNGEAVIFRDKTEITVSDTPVTVPDRAHFFGQASL